MKIELYLCPVCKGHYQINLNHWQEHDDPDVRTCYQVQCCCGYSAELCYSRNEAAIAHNELCELVRLGKAAKEVAENPPQLTVVKTLGENKTKIAHQYYSWAILDCLDLLKAAMEEK